MQTMQRQFGRLMSKGPGENAKVTVLLNDYEDADKILAKIIDNTKLLRDAWLGVATSQFGIVKEYEGLYDPIVGASDGHGRAAVPTPELQLQRTFKLREAYSDLRDELAEEIAAIDTRIIQPATSAREYLQPVRKTIKKRENKRLDYEKCQDKVTKLQKKPGKTPKEDAQLAKAEDEMARTSEEFKIADSHLRETLPPIITAAFSLIPPLMSCHINIQNRLLGIYYTVLHNYCSENDFPSPPPPMDDVIARWSLEFKPTQKEVESIPCIAHGKAVRMPMNIGYDGQERKASASSISSRNGLGRTTSNGTDGAASPIPPRPMRIPSTTSLNVPVSSPAPSEYSPQPSPRSSSTSVNVSGLLRATDFTTASALGGSTPISPQIRGDYFGNQATGSASSIAVKKKPPPPPPPKRAAARMEEYVVALYDFSGQGQGDLSFREGDMIKIVKKTQTDQDWWVGELGGVRGSFPANYCKAT